MPKRQPNKELAAALSGKGSEPTFTGLVWTQLDLVKALNHYAQNVEFDKMKLWALQWLNRNEPSLAKALGSAPAASFMTYGPLCRLSERGFDFDESMVNRILSYFRSLVKSDSPVKEEPVRRPKEKTSKNQEIFDAALDACLASRMSNIPTFEPSEPTKDLEVYCERELKAVQESPEYFRLDQVSALKKFFRGCLDKFSEFKSAKKSQVTVRRKKVSPATIVKSVKFAQRVANLNLKGMNPVDVLDSRKMYVYDAQHRRLILFHATGPGFTFKGTTLLNFDPEKSKSKIIRKPEEFFKSRELSISGLNKAFDSIKAVEKPMTTGRFSEEFLILKAS